ncbi:MAG: YcaO-like family protein [Halodesulfurarchaeum sp.]
MESVDAALSDVEVPTTRTDISAIESADLAVVVGTVGSDGFATANRRALAGGTPWIAVEAGGVGGQPVETVDAGVTVFHPEQACYECLRTRVDAAGAVSDEGRRGNDEERPRVDAIGGASGGATEAGDDVSPTADRSTLRVAGAYAGYLSVQLLNGAALGGTVLEFPHTERTLLPVPDCTCAPARDRSISLDSRSRSLDEAISRAELAVDDRLGIVTNIGEHASFPAPYYLSLLTDTAPFSDASAPDRAAAVGPDWDTAFMKALGESLERYSAAVYRESAFASGTPEEVDGVAPAEFVRPARYRRNDPDAPIRWLPGLDLATGSETMLPADVVQFPPTDSHVRPPITTGLGLGNGPVEAVLSGLYEVIERDATMLSWYSTYEPLGLSVERAEFEALSRRAGGENLSVTPLLVTQDVDVPVVAVAVFREEWPRFAVGSAADLDAGVAATDALAEALQNWMELRDMGREAAKEAEGAIGSYADRPERVETMLSPDPTVPAGDVGSRESQKGGSAREGDRDLDRTGTEGSGDEGDRGAELSIVIDRATDAGLSVYAARITPRDVEHLGFEAVRVVVPSAQPLFVDEPYFGDRARTVPKEMGFEPRLDREFHPYP